MSAEESYGKRMWSLYASLPAGRGTDRTLQGKAECEGQNRICQLWKMYCAGAGPCGEETAAEILSRKKGPFCGQFRL